MNCPTSPASTHPTVILPSSFRKEALDCLRNPLVIKKTIIHEIRFRAFEDETVLQTAESMLRVLRHDLDVTLVGELVEVACETDFVARTDDFKELVRDLAMHVAASDPLAISREDLDPAQIASEREMLMAQAAEMGKPANVLEKIVEGRLEKWYGERVLLEQDFVKDAEQTVEDLVKGAIAKLGENIRVKRIVRLAIGEER